MGEQVDDCLERWCRKAFDYHQRASFEEARVLYERILAHDAYYFSALRLLGILYIQQGRFDLAIAFLRRALRVEPNHVDVLYHLGGAWQSTESFGRAVVCYRRVLRAEATHTLALGNLAYCFFSLGRFQQAIEYYRKVIPLEQDDVKLAEHHFNLSLLLIRNGMFKDGWAHYQWRWKTETYSRSLRQFAQPQWQGENLAERSLYVWPEQGFGDFIYFMQCFPALVSQCARVIVESPLSLFTLTCQSFGDSVDVVKTGQEVDDFDFHVPIAELPKLLSLDLEKFHGRASYLRVSAESLLSVVSDFEPDECLRVGFAWRGFEQHTHQKERSVDLALLLRQLSRQGLTLICLQKDPTEEECLVLRRFGVSLGIDNCEDFAETAAVVCCLDLVVCVDTSVAHLAAALGKPVWLLTPFVADWRWLVEREDCPWYPSLKLFRQERLNDWTAPLQRVVGALRFFEREDDVSGHPNWLLVNFETLNVIQLNDLSVLLARQGYFLEAFRLLQRALSFSKTAELYFYCGKLLSDRGIWINALQYYRRAVRLEPKNSQFLMHMGCTALRLEYWSLAERCFQRALGISPQSDDLRVLYARLLLARGYYVRGWSELSKRRYWEGGSQPKWSGESLLGKVILVRMEPAISDNLLMFRYLPLLCDRAQRVLVLPHPSLEKLTRCVAGVEVVVESALPAFDVHCSLFDLPKIFKTTADSVPAYWLKVNYEGDITRFSNDALMRVGFLWRDEFCALECTNRFPSLSIFNDLLTCREVRWLSLQTSVSSAESQLLELHGVDEHVCPTAGFWGMVQRILTLDLVICVDGAVAHLAALLNKPVWLMVERPAKWCWLQSDRFSCWHPAVRIFRQLCRGDWHGLVVRVIRAMKHLVSLRDFSSVLLSQRQYWQGLFSEWRGQHELALGCYSQALKGKPSVEALLSYALLAQYRVSQHDVEVAYKAALNKTPGHVDVLAYYASFLQNDCRLDESIFFWKKAFKLAPYRMDIGAHLSFALAEQGLYRDALALGRTVQRRAPYLLSGQLMLAQVYTQLGRDKAAEAIFHFILEQDPEHIDAQCAYGILCLLNKRFSEGWMYYESRWKTFDFERYGYSRFSKTQWSGQPLQGKRLLIWSEQGFGDAFFAFRYLNRLQKEAAQVIVEVNVEWISLIKCSFPGLKVVRRGEVLPDYDYHCPALSLMKAVGEVCVTSEPIPYLFVSRQLLTHWQKVFNKNDMDLRVGLVWRGSVVNPRDRFRSVDLCLLNVLTQHVKGVQFYSLQYDLNEEEVRLCGELGVHIFDERFESFESTAAVIEQLDLIISVDTAVVHLAGAMDKPVWVLLSKLVDWRWGRRGKRTFWYPAMTLFRQSKLGDWKPALENIKKALGAWLVNNG